MLIWSGSGICSHIIYLFIYLCTQPPAINLTIFAHLFIIIWYDHINFKWGSPCFI